MQDYIFHVTKDTSTGQLLIGGSNNTNFDPREDLDTLDNHYVVTSAEWYTFEHRMYENGDGDLEVAMNLYDEAGNWLFSEVRDSGQSNFGGNRYLWFTNIDVANGIPVDRVTLDTVDTNPIQRFDGTTILSSHATIQDAIDSTPPGSDLRLSGSSTENVDLNVASTLGGDFLLNGTLTVSATGATLEAGFSPGIISSGSLTLTSGATLAAEINGTTPGTEHDQYVVTGTVDLGSASLSTSGTITASPGDTVVLIDNDAADPVVGTFSGIANGDMISVNGQDFSVFYDGGDGNDVVLVAAPAVTTVYVDDDWAGTTSGADPDAGGPAVAFGIDAFATIQEAINAVDPTGNVVIYTHAGTGYNEALFDQQQEPRS